MTATHVVGICGSLRAESKTRVALEVALEGARERGATADLLDLREYDLPTFDADDREPGDVPALTAAVREADAVLLGTPVYHGSYASPLKTAIDYCGFDEFEDATVGLLAVGGGRFPVTALEHLRSVCRALDAWVLPREAAVPNSHDAVEDGAVVDDDLRDRVASLGERAVRYAHIDGEPPTPESAENVGATE
jgi:NAD(P)H-dependent FMN reductase